jgi:hypothetical protein
MPRRYISRSRWAKFLGSRRPVELIEAALAGYRERALLTNVAGALCLKGRIHLAAVSQSMVIGNAARASTSIVELSVAEQCFRESLQAGEFRDTYATAEALYGVAQACLLQRHPREARAFAKKATPLYKMLGITSRVDACERLARKRR